MVGAGETFVPAFVLALGMGEVLAGLMATVPMLTGAVLQLASPWAVTRLGSRRRWVVTCAACQAASLLLLPLCAQFNGRAAWLVFAAATLYWAAGLATGPAWNAWMETLVPSPLRARFFAARTRICQFGTLAGFLLGGALLHYGESVQRQELAFGLLFVLAALCRFISAACLARQSEFPGFTEREPQLPAMNAAPRDRVEDHVGLSGLIGRLRGHAGARLMVFLLAMQSGVWIAAPFFTPYMLAQLHFSYGQFVVLTALAFVARIMVLPLFGRFAQRAGAYRLFWIGGVSLVPLSALWVFSSSFVYLLVLQFVAGVAWAAYELAMILMFFETIPRSERISMLTLYNLGNSLAMVVGSLLGAALLGWLGEVHSSYLLLFGLSSVVRCVSLVFMARVPRMDFQAVQPATRTLAIRPSAGALESPILPSIDNGDGDADGRSEFPRR